MSARSEADIASRAVELVRQLAGPDASAEVVAHHRAHALTRFANSAIHQNVADAVTTVRLRLHLDGRTSSGSTTLTGGAGLRALVERTIAATRLCPPDDDWPGLTQPTPQPPAAEPYLDQATAVATADDRASRVRDFVDAAGGLVTAGYCRTTYSAAAFANSAGQSASGRTAEAAMDGIARHGGADGVARAASLRLADLDGAALGARAAAKARAGGGAGEIPPGRYEVVLEPTAVADILQNLAYFGFNGKAYAERQSFAEPGAQQFDPAVTIVDDPLAGPGMPFDAEGTPKAALSLVQAGTTRAVTHDRRTAADVGAASTGHASPGSRTWGPVGGNLRLEAASAGPGEPSGGAAGSAGQAADPDIAALVAGVTRGLLVTDLWYTRVLDPKSLVVTGLTRNGVWLIENGEITTAVTNLRFTQSYPQALGPGAVRGLGRRAVWLPDSWTDAWFGAPPIHLASWHITGNASG